MSWTGPSKTAVNDGVAGLKDRPRHADNLLTLVAHELRSPLCTIVGSVEMLLDEDFGSLNKEQRSWVGIVQRSGIDLQARIDLLLDVAQLSTGCKSLQLIACDLSALVERVAASADCGLRERDQRLGLVSSADLPEALCDRRRTEILFSGVLKAASSLAPRGSLVGIRLLPGDEMDMLIVTVSFELATGVLMGGADENPLFSGNHSDWLSAGDLDLELWIAKALAELHGGQFQCGMVSPVHLAFHVTLPSGEEHSGPGR